MVKLSSGKRTLKIVPTLDYVHQYHRKLPRERFIFYLKWIAGLPYGNRMSIHCKSPFRKTTRQVDYFIPAFQVNKFNP